MFPRRWLWRTRWSSATSSGPRTLDIARLRRRPKRLRTSNLLPPNGVRLDGIAEQCAAAHGINPERTATAGLPLECDSDTATVLGRHVGDEGLDFVRRSLRPRDVEPVTDTVAAHSVFHAHSVVAGPFLLIGGIPSTARATALQEWYRLPGTSHDAERRASSAPPNLHSISWPVSADRDSSGTSFTRSR